MGELVYLPLRTEQWVTEQQVANHMSVTTRTIRNWRARGMPAQRFGRMWRYRITEVEGWAANQGAA